MSFFGSENELHYGINNSISRSSAIAIFQANSLLNCHSPDSHSIGNGYYKIVLRAGRRVADEKPDTPCTGIKASKRAIR